MIQNNIIGLFFNPENSTKQLKKDVRSFFHSKSFNVDTHPFLVLPVDMIFHGAFILEEFVTGWAMIVDKRDHVLITHVPPNGIRTHALPTYHAKKASITLLNKAPHQVIHRKVS